MGTRAAASQERIVSDPEVLVGKPVVKGTRIAVELVLEYLAHTPDLDELFADYPELTREDVQAIFGYAHQVVEREVHAPTSQQDSRLPVRQA